MSRQTRCIEYGFGRRKISERFYYHALLISRNLKENKYNNESIKYKCAWGWTLKAEDVYSCRGQNTTKVRKDLISSFG